MAPPDPGKTKRENTRGSGTTSAKPWARRAANYRLPAAAVLFQEFSRSIENHFFIWAIEPPRLLYSNEAIATLSGRPLSDFVDDSPSFLDLVLPEYREEFVNTFRQGLESPQELEYRIRRADGSIRWLRTRVYPCRDEKGRELRIAGLSEDITQRVSIREAGARSKEFEAMLAGVSNRFAQAPLGELDAAIGAALAAVSSFADVERSHVYLFDRDRETMREIARWPPPEMIREDDPLRLIPPVSLPFFSAELFSQRDVVLADVDEVPESASADRAFLVLHGVRACLNIPLTAAGETTGALTLTTLSRRLRWSDEEISMLHIAADVIAAGLTRREAERDQQDSINFERLITSLISEFMNIPADELDVGVARALETIARFVDCDRTAIFIVDEGQGVAKLYRGWWAPGAAPVVGDYDRIEATPDSLYGRWIRSDAPYLILSAPEIENLRPDASPAIRENRMGTIASFPLVIDGRRVGWFGVGAKLPRVGWDSAELRSLGLAANALANMYARRESEKERHHHQSFEETLAALAADFIKRPLSQIRTGIEEIIDRFGRFADSDRAAVLLFDETNGTASTYHEWVAKGEPAPIHDFLIADAPWFFHQITTSRRPSFLYIEEFPESDRLAAMALEAIGIRTLLNCSIADDENVFGYASIGYPGSRHRPVAGTEQVLAVAAGIIANALSRERLESQAVKQREALAHALRIGSLGELATGIAHELNQPLTAIVNYSSAGVRWLDGTDLDRAALAGILERVSDEAIRAGDLIHSLRKHVKRGPKKRVASSIREIVDNACSLLAGTARDHAVTIQTKYGASLPQVHAEPTEIGQVIINVVQNAIESINAADAKVRKVRISCLRNRELVEVEITDTGPGFGGGDLGRLFDQFYTTKPGGLGLGLSISRSLIESNGGTMVAAQGSRGASIRFTLPVASLRRGRRTS